MDSVDDQIARIYREHSGKAFATLVRLLGGDFDLAEEALQEAFAQGIPGWRDQGLPSNPFAWLVSTARFKAIDMIRRRERLGALEPEIRRRVDEIEEGVKLVQESLASGQLGSYNLQAAIAAVHSEATSTEATDWNQIVALYSLLLRTTPSPVVELNRAVAVAMRDGPEAGLALIDEILARGELVDYHLAHAARGELLRRAGRLQEAREAIERGLSLAKQEPERRLLLKRLNELREP